MSPPLGPSPRQHFGAEAGPAAGRVGIGVQGRSAVRCNRDIWLLLRTIDRPLPPSSGPSIQRHIDCSGVGDAWPG